MEVRADSGGAEKSPTEQPGSILARWTGASPSDGHRGGTSLQNRTGDESAKRALVLRQQYSGLPPRLIMGETFGKVILQQGIEGTEGVDVAQAAPSVAAVTAPPGVPDNQLARGRLLGAPMVEVCEQGALMRPVSLLNRLLPGICATLPGFLPWPPAMFSLLHPLRSRLETER